MLNWLDLRAVPIILREILKESRTLRYVRASHNLPIIVSADHSIKKLEAGGLILGAVPEVEYEVSEVQLEEGDVLCLYTDGMGHGSEG